MKNGDPRRSAVLPNGGTSGRRLSQGPERPGEAANVRRKRCRIPRRSLQLSNPHVPRQFGLANAGGQMRSRTESDYPDSSESAGRSIFEMLQTDVPLVSFDHRKEVCESLSVPLKNPMKQTHGVLHTADTRQIYIVIMLVCKRS